MPPAPACGDLLYKPRSSGYEGKIPLVNGTRDAYVDVDRAVYRLRILNGANGRIFRLALGGGEPMRLIGNDGGLLEFGEDDAAFRQCAESGLVSRSR